MEVLHDQVAPLPIKENKNGWGKFSSYQMELQIPISVIVYLFSNYPDKNCINAEFLRIIDKNFWLLTSFLLL